MDNENMEEKEEEKSDVEKRKKAHKKKEGSIGLRKRARARPLLQRDLRLLLPRSPFARIVARG